MVEERAIGVERVGGYQFHMWGPSPYYRSPAHWRHPDGIATIVASIVARGGWISRSDGIWESLTPEGTELPASGWKVHVSATPDAFEPVARAAAGVCADRGVPFKVLADRRMHLVMNSKYTPRGGSGKAFVAYPPQSGGEFERFVDELEQALVGYPGPRVLSDIRISRAPVFARFGAFTDRWGLGADGELFRGLDLPGRGVVPDRRMPGAHVPEGVEVPDWLERRRRGSGALEAGYSITGALHFSNAGGVYSAEGADGRALVVKESRPGAGIDVDGDDAVVRSEREAAALGRLDGMAGVPSIVETTEVDGHRYLATTRLDGDMLWQWQGKVNPLIRPGSTADERAEFARRAMRLTRSVERLVAEMHRRGVTHGDLHPGNILATDDDEARLIDFEVARSGTDAAAPRRAMGGLGFVPATPASGVDTDRHALAALRLWMLLPLNASWAHRPALAGQIAADAVEAFGVDPGYLEDAVRLISADAPVRPPAADAADAPADARRDPATTTTDRLWRGVEASEDPDDPDGPFPGDIRRFEHAGACFAFGTAGILWARLSRGLPIEGRLVDHVVRASKGPDALRPGFAMGRAGTLPLLAALDDLPRLREEVALTAAAAERVSNIDVWAGLSGVGLTLLALPRTAVDPTTILDLARRVVLGVEEHAGLAGLMRGTSGAALFLAECADRFDREDLRHAAHVAFERDLRSTTVTESGSRQSVEPGRRTLAYLESGSAGLVLVAHRLGRGAEFPELLEALASEYVAEPGLLMGRAGLMLALTDVARSGGAGAPRASELLRMHRRRLAWHLLPSGDDLQVPGAQGFRLSSDLGTGAVGVAHVLHCMDDATTRLLPFLSASVDSIEDPPHPRRGGELMTIDAMQEIEVSNADDSMMLAASTASTSC